MRKLIRMYAEALAEIVKALWPRTWALFEEHTLHAVTLSRSEALTAREMLAWAKDKYPWGNDCAALCKKLGL